MGAPVRSSLVLIHRLLGHEDLEAVRGEVENVPALVQGCGMPYNRGRGAIAGYFLQF